jgi:hypothetical protein
MVSAVGSFGPANRKKFVLTELDMNDSFLCRLDGKGREDSCPGNSPENGDAGTRIYEIKGTNSI